MDAHGLPGTGSIESTLTPMQKNGRSGLHIVSNESNGAVIDAGGQSLFAVAEAAIDLCVSLASKSAPGRVTIANGQNAIAVLSGIYRCSRMQNSLAAWWLDDDDSICHVVCASKADRYPEYKRFQLNENSDVAANSVEIICALDEQELTAYLPDTTSWETVESIDPEDFVARRRLYVDTGIEIDEIIYQQLCEIADRVLVESTDQSRSGAGE